MTAVRTAAAPTAGATPRAVVPERVPLLRRRVTLTTAVVALAVVVMGMRYELSLNVTLGTLAGVALAPVWLPVLSRYRGATTIALISLLCLPVGVWLTMLSSDSRGTIDRLVVLTSVLLLNFVLGIGVLLWARTRMPDAAVALLYGFGMLLAGAGDRAGENPWRFAFSVPVSVMLLALAWWSGKRWVEVVTALALAAVTAASGGRSMFAMLVLAAVAVMWQATPRTIGRRTSRLRSAVFLAAAVALLYSMGQSLALEGYLGQSAQQRTMAQVSTTGSVLLGGRPEMGATFALMAHEPQGFGSGTRLNATDLLVAKSGMADLGYDPNNGYVERYMFGGGLELHSFWADLWADFGWLGALLGAVLAWRLVSHLSGALAQRTASALIVYVVVQDLWNMLFSPRYGSYALMTLAIALVLAPAAEARRGRRGRGDGTTSSAAPALAGAAPGAVAPAGASHEEPAHDGPPRS